MRLFTFASGAARKEVDLRDFEDIIINTVKEVIPGAKVKVYPYGYVVDKITRGEAIKIGRKLASTDLCTYCIKISKLFNGENLYGDFSKLEEDKEE